MRLAPPSAREPRGSSLRAAVAVPAAAMAILAYGLGLFGLPPESGLVAPLSDLGSLAAAVVAAGAALAAARRQRCRQARWSWLLFAGALAGWAFGDGYWSWSEVVLGEAPDVPSWADVGYVAMALLAVGGAALHPIVRVRDVGRRLLLLDAAVVLSASLAVAWSVLLAPLFARLQTDPLIQVLVSVYPLGSLATTFVLVILLLRSARPRLTTALLVPGWTLVALADATYLVLAVERTYVSGHLIDVAWFAGAVLIGLAALLDDPGPALLPPDASVGHRWQFVAPSALAVAAIVVVWATASEGPGGWPAPEWLALGLTVLLLVVRAALGYRDVVLVHELFVEQAHEREAARAAREETARLQGVVLTGRELGELLSNDLTTALGWMDVLRQHPALPPELRAVAEDAATGLDRAVVHLQRLQRVSRVATRQTPIGPALDLERSAEPSLASAPDRPE